MATALSVDTVALLSRLSLHEVVSAPEAVPEAPVAYTPVTQVVPSVSPSVSPSVPSTVPPMVPSAVPSVPSVVLSVPSVVPPLLDVRILPLQPSKAHRRQLKRALKDAVKAVAAKSPTKAHRRQLGHALKKAQAVVASRAKRRAMTGADVTTPRLSVAERSARLVALRELERPEQRSEAWYAKRDRMITASNFGQAVKTPAARATFAKTTAAPLLARQAAAKKGEVYTRPVRRSGGAACEHGVMFEPACDLVYRTMCRPGAATEDFGLLPHPTVAFLGASPDGICNETSASEYVGRLVEFKAPYSRPIVPGVVPEAYLAQMQGQLEVTGLDECDYLECAFKRHERKEQVSETPVHGAIVAYQTGEGKGTTRYKYGPWNAVDDDTVLGMLDDTVPDNAKVVYWSLEAHQLVTVRRNAAWWAEVMYPALADVWTAAQNYLTPEE